MAEIDLTKAELLTIANLVDNKSVKVANPEEFEKHRVIVNKILEYLSGPGLDLGGE